MLRFEGHRSNVILLRDLAGMDPFTDNSWTLDSGPGNPGKDKNDPTDKPPKNDY